MAYVCEDTEALEGTPVMGSRQCVALVQLKAGAPVTAAWRAGVAVKDNLALRKGTAIATFVDGRYPNHAHDNHAALYLSQDAVGILVMDQWKSANKLTVSKRTLYFKGKDKLGRYPNASQNADAFSVIE